MWCLALCLCSSRCSESKGCETCCGGVERLPRLDSLHFPLVVNMGSQTFLSLVWKSVGLHDRVKNFVGGIELSMVG